MSERAPFPAPDAKPTAKPAATDLCTHCGLCCDGTVFANAKVHPEDEADLAELGIPIDPASNRPAFLQPCAALAGTRCTIYPRRFVACRNFRCRLLLRLDADEITFEAGLATIAQARSLIAAVEPAARTVRERRVLFQATARWKNARDPVARAAMVSRHLAMAALEHFLDRHFRKARTPSP